MLQFVAKINSDVICECYLRSEEGSRGIAGDVIVGWIKARSGKGSVDDYFLASDHERCPDDAESCPDTSQGPLYLYDIHNILCYRHPPLIVTPLTVTQY